VFVVWWLKFKLHNNLFSRLLNLPSTKSHCKFNRNMRGGEAELEDRK